MNVLIFLYIPLIAGVICLLIPRSLKYFHAVISTIASLAFFLISIRIFSMPDIDISIPWFQIGILDFAIEFRLYHTSKFFLIFIGLFSFLTFFYSIYYFKNKPISHLYYPFLLWTLAGSAAIVLANNFFILLLGWELVTLLLFFLISMGNGKSAAMAAGKSFAILGFTDAALIFGVLALLILYGTWNISSLSIHTSDPFSIIIFIILFVAAIAKAGSMPLHSWIPDVSLHAPLPVVALLPASLDKLLGIYLLLRLMYDVFIVNQTLLTILLVIGALTLIVTNIIALVQNDLRKFLGFATIAQVGYMLIGFGTGTILGMMAGLFHMLNHAIYKIALFFGVGIVEKETGTTEMNKLGGLAKDMPHTFILMTIGMLAASGIPPLNAFISKWMVYQSTLDAGKPLMLIIAMFGSALTLASFLKMWFSIFHGHRSKGIPKKVNDPSFIGKTVLLIPILLCIIFGIFAQIPINQLIGPIFGENIGTVTRTINIGTAFFNPSLAIVLLISGLIIGLILFFISRIKTRYVETLFIGGEKFETQTNRYIAEHLYETLSKMNFIGTALNEGKKGIFDIYNLSSSLGLILVNTLKKLHDGILSTYLAWCVIGLGIISFLLIVL